MADFRSIRRTCRGRAAAKRGNAPRRLQALAICLVGLLASGAAATCAAYYMAEPPAHRPPAIFGDGLRAHANPQPGSRRKDTPARPVRVADADAWLDSLRSGAYWKQKKSEPRTARPEPRKRSQSGGGPGVHRLSTMGHVPEAASRASSYRQKEGTARPEPRKRSQSGGARGVHRPSSMGHAPEVASRASSYRQKEGTAYRTVCVRLCDGFFWPVSFATTRANLKRDGETCQNSCASPVALYADTNLDGGPEGMVDLDGQPYTRLGRAFLYRTTYRPSCKCRPHPWEQEAIERHRGYAENAAGESLEARSEQ